MAAVRVEGFVDDGTFDRLTRLVDRIGSRRGTLRGLAGAGIAAALGRPGFEATAKKKKKKKKKPKCKAPNSKCGIAGCCNPNQRCLNGACEGLCTFTQTATRWTLQRDCVTQSPITIPAGRTLDGAGHTIFLQGPIATLPYGVGAAEGTVDIENLTIDGSGMTGPCGLQRGIGIQFTNASGSVRNSAVIGLSSACGFAISVVAPDGSATPRPVVIDAVSIDDALSGIVASAVGRVALSVTECDMQRVRFGIQVDYNVEATIADNEIAATTYGVVILSSSAVTAAPDVTATGNTVTGAQIGMSVAAATANPGPGTPTLEASGNTIVGPGPIAAGATHGLQFGKQAAGSADGNTISNFFDNRGGFAGCGIFVAADAGDVEIGTNTYPTPPGNEQNECGV